MAGHVDPEAVRARLNEIVRTLEAAPLEVVRTAWEFAGLLEEMDSVSKAAIRRFFEGMEAGEETGCLELWWDDDEGDLGARFHPKALGGE